jgi:hypothetical protein
MNAISPKTKAWECGVETLPGKSARSLGIFDPEILRNKEDSGTDRAMARRSAFAKCNPTISRDYTNGDAARRSILLAQLGEKTCLAILRRAGIGARAVESPEEDTYMPNESPHLPEVSRFTTADNKSAIQKETKVPPPTA